MPDSRRESTMSSSDRLPRFHVFRATLACASSPIDTLSISWPPRQGRGAISPGRGTLPGRPGRPLRASQATGDADLPEIIVKVLGEGAFGEPGRRLLPQPDDAALRADRHRHDEPGSRRSTPATRESPFCGGAGSCFEECRIGPLNRSPAPRTRPRPLSKCSRPLLRDTRRRMIRHRAGRVRRGHGSDDRSGFLNCRRHGRSALSRGRCQMVDGRMNPALLVLPRGLTGLDYTLTLTDIVTGAVRTFESPKRSAAERTSISRRTEMRNRAMRLWWWAAAIALIAVVAVPRLHAQEPESGPASSCRGRSASSTASFSIRPPPRPSTRQPPSGLDRSIDPGANWESRNRGLEGHSVLALAVDPARTCSTRRPDTAACTSPDEVTCGRGQLRLTYLIASSRCSGAAYAGTEAAAFFGAPTRPRRGRAHAADDARRLPAIAVDPQDPDLHAGTNSEASSGAWTGSDLDPPPAAEQGNHLVARDHPTKGTTVYATAHAGLFRSDDSGVTWRGATRA